PPGASPPRPGATPPGATPPSPGASPPGATPLPPGASPAPGSEGAPEPKTGKAETGEPGKEGEAKADEQSSESFVKGELSSFIGATKLATKNNRIGVCLGYKMLDLVHYATITPEADLRFGKLTFGLGVPLALQVFDGNLEEGQDASEGFDDAGAFRTEDWDEPGEYVRFIRYLTWGRKEDNIYFSLSQLGSNSLGHGALARRYSVNIDPNSARVAGQLDMYNDYAGFEFMVNSIVDWEIFGALGFVKPLSFFLDNEIARSLSIGFTYMADRAAPVSLVTQSDPANPFFIMGKGRPDVASDAFLHAMGVDVEIKVLRTDTVDIKPFIDISWMLPGTPSGETPPDVSGGNGFTLGLLGRFSFGAESVHALRIIAELRSFSSNYMPGYFDTFYEVQKYAVSQDYKKYAAETGALPPTKFYEIFHNRRDGDRKWGFYLEFSYALIGKVSLTLALEGSDADYGNHFLAHLEVPALDWLQFFASFHQRAMPSVGDIFSLNACDKVLFTAVRLKLLPFLFVNFRYHFTLGLREQYADLTGDGFENHYRFYEPYHGIMGDVEFGWEF
ncbi:MAG: hypothetical protein JXR96_31215, partial [Deltaproteobacteria bacterium]|nr:hypothetical protein [Deltaproteobacteria bacterium]